MRFIYKSYNIDYNLVSDIAGFNSQIRLENPLNRRCQYVRLYKSQQTDLYKESTGFLSFKDMYPKELFELF